MKRYAFLGLVKAAQSMTGYAMPNRQHPTSVTPAEQARNRLYADKIVRGGAKGLRNVPSLLTNFFVSLPAGIQGGHVRALTTNPLKKNPWQSWKEGFLDSYNFAERNYSDNINKLLMAAGGNKVRDLIDGQIKKDKFDLKRHLGYGSDEYNKTIDRANGIESGASAIAEIAGSAPAFGAALGPVFSAASRTLGSVAPKVMGAVPVAARTALSRIPAVANKAVQYVPSWLRSAVSKAVSATGKALGAIETPAFYASAGAEGYSRGARKSQIERSPNYNYYPEYYESGFEPIPEDVEYPAGNSDKPTSPLPGYESNNKGSSFIPVPDEVFKSWSGQR